MRIVFDLDSTLADDSHRIHYLKKEPKDWDGYYSECFKDTSIQTTFKVLRALASAEHLVEIWTGRVVGEGDVIRNLTVSWLNNHGLYVRGSFKGGHDTTIERLLMRRQGDYTDDDELKRRWLNAAREADQAPDLVFEDRNRVVDMWREEGITCFQVAVGNF